MTILTEAVARLLLAPSLMVAAAILIKGYVDVGDGFAAAVVVSLAIALQYLAFGARRAEQELPVLRFAPQTAIVGLLVALSSGFFAVISGGAPFTHEPSVGARVVRIGRLELMTAVSFDFGIFLLIAGALVALIHHLAEPPELEPDLEEDAEAAR
ncbi:MnhB domain-containing protein [Conexibacter arvalis]|uniref:Multicomponent Na+:H+ antiporter subunit B n=1 Tax=Conexibacter arvalis TaxID=912552 RepID=A0A840IE02_9ACTN|nr:multicomponent Na+:H+ antiporter subunit B [Conexibacter arvalis]